MDQVFFKKKGVVRCYFVIIPAVDWRDMYKKIESVFQANKCAKLTLNPNRWAFGVTELDYLGFNIKEGQLRPSRKTAIIEIYQKLGEGNET